MTRDDLINAVKETAAQVEGDVRGGYSGRGMYGKSCYGIVCDDPVRCIEVASANGLKGARTDGMGKRSIVYWPRVSA